MELPAELEKAIADFISEKFDTIPAESTIREHISPALEKWREDKVKAGNSVSGLFWEVGRIRGCAIANHDRGASCYQKIRRHSARDRATARSATHLQGAITFQAAPKCVKRNNLSLCTAAHLVHAGL